ncbi:ATP-binding protein [Blastococcus montanus]|uniref:ATP-binding protein n=1 Tax=Blastococcus montanus TaxID=3144973 RepID=UPI00320B1810
MNVEFSVRLPTDTHSVPLVRGLVRQALEHLRVPGAVVEEIVLALTEACANVVDHAADQDVYQVDVAIDEQLCRISVLDGGDGFDVAATQDAGTLPTDDRGRGLQLMHSLTDRLEFGQGEDGRHRVTFEKWLAPPPRLRLLDPN